MGRPPSIVLPGAWYHVVNRGHRQGAVFLDAPDRCRDRALLEAVRFGGCGLKEVVRQIPGIGYGARRKGSGGSMRPADRMQSVRSSTRV